MKRNLLSIASLRSQIVPKHSRCYRTFHTAEIPHPFNPVPETCRKSLQYQTARQQKAKTTKHTFKKAFASTNAVKPLTRVQNCQHRPGASDIELQITQNLCTAAEHNQHVYNHSSQALTSPSSLRHRNPIDFNRTQNNI